MQEQIFEIPSTTTRIECYVLFELASKLPPSSTLVEIGTGAGRVTAVLAEAIAGKGSVLHTIDNYSQHEKYDIYGPWTAENAKKWMQRLNVGGHVRHIEGDSVAVAKTFTASVDFIYFDGGHRYQEVCADLVAWLPRVKYGGIIAGHDFDFNCDDGRNVIKAVFDKLMKFPDKAMTVRERCWWLEK